jgi:hypothetical protein
VAAASPAWRYGAAAAGEWLRTHRDGWLAVDVMNVVELQHAAAARRAGARWLEVAAGPLF